MNNENLRRCFNVVKYQIQKAFDEAADAAGREMTRSETMVMIELMGRLSNAQACLEAGLGTEEVLVQLGQLEAWDETFANRGAPDADVIWGPRAVPLEA